ncbi:peptide-methionine (S)-S-oxide reductase MsrA [Luteimonas kalidii]|uniref:Peptide methionine sulfoxide reductase MsrA n=1 Tax=Luteimonas kalidii TaxID=3042025 RepID=A0ABT6JRM5_9GAMM|nr:peptide-methionine (S)-S-oxide reductase MsrA [Luteimonas kalidii]MDH5833145.1 peptide-methionine (S)-S-oxide reductase MsrA [Luteimonas kalidii]
MIGIGAWKQRLPAPGEALPGRAQPLPLHNRHHVLGTPLKDGFEGLARVQFGMGCFWGAERAFWSLPGVVTTAVGYAGGQTPNPTYREVCSGQTGHAEVVLVVYDPAKLPFETLLQTFWEGHDPTQGMRQGNDAGTQYRSAIYSDTPEQHALASRSRDAYQASLREAGHGAITTELVHPAPTFHYAENEHQQYLSKHPAGYCGLGGTGVSCPVGLA